MVDTAPILPRSDKSLDLAEQLLAFMANYIYPAERQYYLEAERLGPWAIFPTVERLKPIARNEGLWIFFFRSMLAAFPISTMHRSVRSWAEACLALRFSTAQRPTQATWKQCFAMVPKCRKSAG